MGYTKLQGGVLKFGKGGKTVAFKAKRTKTKKSRAALSNTRRMFVGGRENFGFNSPSGRELKELLRSGVDIYLQNPLYDDVRGRTCLNDIAAGTEVFQRVGQRINVKSIELRATLRGPTGRDLTGDFCRMALVINKQQNRAITQTRDLVWASTPTNSLRRYNDLTKYSVLWDTGPVPVTTRGLPFFGFGSYPPMAADGSLVPIEYYRRCDIPVQYGGTAGDFAQIVTNGLWLFYWSDFTNFTVNPTDSGSAVTLNFQVRIRYTDS